MPPIVEARNLSKKYRLGHSIRHHENFREFLQRHFTMGGKSQVSPSETTAGKRDDFWALRDVNFDIAEGEVVAIIGRNGAGKSTLLKILSQITDPTEGYVKLRGRVASLLEVGTGFHPELTGRENVFLNGALLGMSRAEIISNFDEIVAFSENEKFLDTPVKHYSSGMYVRLAFAVAAHLTPDILIVDEVLSVGDMSFQKKCLGKMDEVSRAGRTVLFVTHNMAAAGKLCQRGIVLEQGRIAFDGGSKEAIERYVQSVWNDRDGKNGSVIDLEGARIRRSEMGRLLTRLEFTTNGDEPLNSGLPIGAPLRVRVHFNIDQPTSDLEVGLAFDGQHRERLLTMHTSFEPQRPEGKWFGPQVLVCDVPSLTLMPGEYSLQVWLDIKGRKADQILDASRLTVVESDYYGTGKAPWNGAFVLKHHWYPESPADMPKPSVSINQEISGSTSPVGLATKR